MSNDAAVTKDLLQTLEDGRDGFAKGAEKLESDGEPGLAGSFRQFAAQREQLAKELEVLAASYGDQIEESGSLAAKAHRGWMAVKDAVSGSDPSGVLDAAEQGEDHAVDEYRKALDADISPELRVVVERQLEVVQAAHDRVKELRNVRS
jgi:uncharacterized protein (TIGR02284 family)